MKLLFKVGDIFQISGRGVVIIPRDFAEDFRIRVGDKIQIRIPGGRSINTLVAGVEFAKVEKGPCKMAVLLPKDIKREDVTSDSEIWSLDYAVTTDGLIKQFGRFAALRGITEQFSAGKLYVIVGDNGAGKTTLLRTFAGLSAPTRGSVTVLGASEVKRVTAQIGYMAHPSLLYDEMTGMENLHYFARLYGIEDGAKSREAVLAVKLDPALDRPVGQYSQGMKQRMSLSRALLNDPKLLLLDEPFSNVDGRSAKEMATLLAQLRDAGKTIFVVTHQPALLEHAADEFIAMDAGRVVSRTTALQVTAP